MRLWSAVAVAAILSLSCKGATDSSLCLEALALTVDEGTSLRFSWSPTECGVVDLSVAPAAGVEIKWLLQSMAAENAIHPPVVYGQTPPGPFSASGAEPLYPGITYRVILSRNRSGGGEYVAGEASFTVTRRWQ
jgi:hypothetical protein